MEQPIQISMHLPFDVRLALIRAAKTPVTEDRMARIKAIEEVTRRAKANFPRFFKDFT